MKRIDPETFIGPRAYFTNFDYRIISRCGDLNGLRLDIERRLKILLLTKTTIVCAASHLTSEFTYRLFQANPILLRKGLVLPALRRDKSDISELFEQKRIPSALKEEMIQFYKKSIEYTVDWKLEENAGWFRDAFLRELKDERSVLRKNLKNLAPQQLERLVQGIEKDRLLAREKIDRLAAGLPPGQRQVLIDFRELIYHMSGARVVNCESTLPQENYLDYSLADVESRQTVLSDLQVFWKLFLELALESTHKSLVPMELLDILSFEEVCKLRNPIENSTFREKYENLVVQSAQSLEREFPDRLLYDIEEILRICNQIADNFKRVFESELPAFLKRKVLGNAKELGKSSVSLSLGIASLFPPASVAASVGSIINSFPAFWFNLTRSFKDMSAIDDYRKYMEEKGSLYRQLLERMEISDKSALLDVCDMLITAIAEKLKL